MQVGIDAIEARIEALAALLRRERAQRPGVSVVNCGVESAGIAQCALLRRGRGGALRATGGRL